MAEGAAAKVISQEELNKHDNKNDLWITVCGNVYNVTDYMEHHPGGIERLVAQAPPKDATEEWRRAEGGGHSKGARMKMAKLMVGSLEGATPSEQHKQWLDPMYKFDRDVLNSPESDSGMNPMVIAALFVFIAAGVAMFLPQIKEALGIE